MDRSGTYVEGERLLRLLSIQPSFPFVNLNPKRYGAHYPGIRSPSSNIYPLKLVTQLYRIAQSSTPSFSLGLHTQTPVTSVTRYAPPPAHAGPARRWVVTTPRGHITCQYVIHATNGYASHLLPHLSPGLTTTTTTTISTPIIPVRGQVTALRATQPLADLTTTAWDANEGFEYWFPRPVPNPSTDPPIIILGGGREAARPEFEIGVDDDGVVNPVVTETLRRFLPGVFPGTFSEREPEMEWVSDQEQCLFFFVCLRLLLLLQTGIMGFTKSGYPLVSRLTVFLNLNKRLRFPNA